MNSVVENFSSDVDIYLMEVSDEARFLLEQIRSMIMMIIPEAEEVISYNMPAYKYHGILIGFNAQENYCEFDVMSPALMRAFQERLEEYDTESGIIKLSTRKPLDVTLINDLIQARKKENEFYAKMLC